MKKMIFAGLLIGAFSTASYSGVFVAEGQTHTTLGDYKIEIADNPAIINNEQFKTFLITYENSPLEVKVVVMKGKKCKNYIVLSDKLSVQYVCNHDYFGVQKLDKSLNGLSNSEDLLDRTEYFHQKVISSGMKSDIESAQFIAAFFPLLINEEALAAM